MKELDEMELKQVDGGMPWLGLGNINVWMAANIAEFVGGIADGWKENTPK